MRLASAALVTMFAVASGACQAVPAGARAPARGEQLIKVATISPSSARITIDGVEAGRSTSGVFWATLRRDMNHVIVVEAEGYLPSAQQVKTMPSPHRDGTRTAADILVGEMLLEPERLHPESVFFQLVPDPDFGRAPAGGTTAATVPSQAPTAEGTPPSVAQPNPVAAGPDRSRIAEGLKADLKSGRIDIDEFDARMKALYPDSLR